MRKDGYRLLAVFMMTVLLSGCAGILPGRDASSADNAVSQSERKKERKEDESDDTSRSGRKKTTEAEEPDDVSQADASRNDTEETDASQGGTSPADASQDHTQEDGRDDRDEKTGSSPGKPGEDDTTARMRAYQDVLNLYKEAQDGKYSPEQVEEIGLHTELVQHGWPYATAGDEVRYLYFDVDSDGTDELIFTYHDDIQDIYAYDGNAAKPVWSTPYRGIATLYPDDLILLYEPYGVSGGVETWSQYDGGLCDYFDVFQYSYGEDGESWHTYSYYYMDESTYEYMMEIFEESGRYPAWIHEWAEELTEDEYERLLPKADPVRLPQGETLSGSDSSDDVSERDTADSITLTDEMQKDLNLFLSNFAEQFFEYYDYGHPDAERLIQFSFSFSWINKRSNIEEENTMYRMGVDKVKTVLNKYFVTVLRDDELYGAGGPIPRYSFYQEKEYFYFPPPGGVMYNAIAVVEQAENSGNDQLVLYFKTYVLDPEIYRDYNGVIPQRYYALSKREADQTQYLTEDRDGMAVVKKVPDGYRLQYYQLY